MQTELTLILIKEGNKILLGKKKYGFGKDKYNGYGGKTEPGENPYEAIIREVKEEAEIELEQIKKIGEITFYMNKKDIAGANSFNMHDTLFVHVFIGWGIIGTPVETNEMIPEWFPADQLPYEQMWSDDIYWMPFLLKEVPFAGYCKFGGDDVTIIEHSFKEVEAYTK